MVKHIIDENSCYRDGTIHGDYDCTLNQTDIKKNANKFYIMQIISKGGKYYVFIRYGRVGEIGRISHKEFSFSRAAESFFTTQFRSKTGNHWGATFEPKKGKYWLCEMDYDDVDGLEDAETESKKNDGCDEAECALRAAIRRHVYHVQ